MSFDFLYARRITIEARGNGREGGKEREPTVSAREIDEKRKTKQRNESFEICKTTTKTI